MHYSWSRACQGPPCNTRFPYTLGIEKDNMVGRYMHNQSDTYMHQQMTKYAVIDWVSTIALAKKYHNCQLILLQNIILGCKLWHLVHAEAITFGLKTQTRYKFIKGCLQWDLENVVLQEWLSRWRHFRAMNYGGNIQIMNEPYNECMHAHVSPLPYCSL